MTDKERPWTAFYGPSVRKDIISAHYRTVGDLVSATAHLYGKQPAFTTCLPNTPLV